MMSIFSSKRHKVERLDFIVAGDPKSGTTALGYFVKKHPQMALPDRQELHFFDDEGIFSRPVDYELLHRHFRPIGRVQSWLLPVRLRPIAGEVTPSYLYWKQSMEQIRHYNPQYQLLHMLRSPTHCSFAYWT